MEVRELMAHPVQLVAAAMSDEREKGQSCRPSLKTRLVQILLKKEVCRV